MDTFTFDPHFWRIGRIFGGNPLLRRTDRIEALVTLIAVLVALMGVSVAGVVGTVVYGARDGRYVQEARERHAVTATVTGIDSSDAAVVQARWPAAPPTPTWHAVADAVGVAEAVAILVVVGMTLLVSCVRSRLDRARDAQWECELRSLEDDGGRTNQL
jgi:Tfp pilus assembly protein PilV